MGKPSVSRSTRYSLFQPAAPWCSQDGGGEQYIAEKNDGELHGGLMKVKIVLDLTQGGDEMLGLELELNLGRSVDSMWKHASLYSQHSHSISCFGWL